MSCVNPECVNDGELLKAELEGFDEGYDAGFDAALETTDDEPSFDEGFDEGYAEAAADIHSALVVLLNEQEEDTSAYEAIEEAIGVVEGFIR